MLKSLNLKHGGTRRRVLAFLAIVDAKGAESWSVEDLDFACGQRNKPLGRFLRGLFIQTNFAVPKKPFAFSEYRPVKALVDELREQVKSRH